MVQHVEALARIAGNQGALDLAHDLKQVAEKHRGKSPKFLEGVTIFGIKASKYDHPNFVHDREKRTVQLKLKDGANVEQLVPVELTPRENGFLTELEQAPNKVRTTKELKEKVFGENYSDESIIFYFRSLRIKLEPDPKHPETFLKRRGFGYMFVDESRNISRETVGDNKDQQKTEQSKKVYSYMGFTWNPDMFVIKYKGKEIDFTKTETYIFGFLIECAGGVIAHSTLYQEIFDSDDPSLCNGTLRKHIHKIRKKVKEATREDSAYIETVDGVGYRMAREKKPTLPNSATIFESTA